MRLMKRKCGSYNSGIMQRHLPGSILIVRDRYDKRHLSNVDFTLKSIDKIMKSENSAQIPPMKTVFLKKDTKC